MDVKNAFEDWEDTDTYFDPWITEDSEAYQDFIDTFKNKKFRKDILFKRLNFIFPWKDHQNDLIKLPSMKHICFPVDFKLYLKYKKDTYKKLEIYLDWNFSLIKTFKIVEGDNIKADICKLNFDKTSTIIIGDERKDFLPDWCDYNKPNKTIIEKYDHKNKIKIKK